MIVEHTMEELSKGTIINGRYRFKKYLGKGTFGEVWLAMDLQTHEEVAVKLYVSMDNRGCEEFLDEYSVAAGLHHKNLLKTHEYNLWNGRPYLVLDYLSEGSAEKYIGRLQPGKVDELIIWRFIRDVASGLAYLHSLEPDPIVHQDIKPANILLNYRGDFIITDFGISKKMRGTMRSQSLRDNKGVDGSRSYMAPELFTSGRSVLASDIWSLGASIYELAEGQLPFMGQGGYGLNIGFSIPELGEGWSKNLEAVMQYCMAKEPWDRAKAAEVAELAEAVLKDFDVDSVAQITKIKEKRGIHTKVILNKEPVKEPVKESAKEPFKESVKEPAPESANRPPKKKGGAWKWALAVLGILMAGGIVAFVFLFNPDTELEMANKSKDRYQFFVNRLSDMYNKQDKTDPDYDTLLTMMSYSDSLNSYEANYQSIIPDFYNKSPQLSSLVTKLRKTAAYNWAEYARSESDTGEAIEAYKKSLFLWKDSSVEEELNKLYN